MRGAPTRMTDSHVTRAGEKLEAALKKFGVSAAGKICADLGSHKGGFVDCLLQRGAAKVHSVDTSYGTLAWELRKDPRVVVHERRNALHWRPPETIDVVSIDVGWTRQEHILPHVFSWNPAPRIVISLLKPHYEAEEGELIKGVLPDALGEAAVERVLAKLKALNLPSPEVMESPIRGGAGNREFLLGFAAS
ncbi:MAG: SAM-dependent methyltransferase [Planctomycetota bacterium]